MRLTQLLAEEPSVATTDTWALLALMCFNAARVDSRLDDEGRLVPLDRQDRTRWDQSLIQYGYRCLARSADLDPSAPSRFHVEAAIAARHCSAPSFEDTDWHSICQLYDRLLERTASPMVALNRAVAISYRDGPEPALALVETIRRSGDLPHSHAVAAVLANLHARVGAIDRATEYLDEALSRARTPHERDLIARQVGRAARRD
jgi:RNA polymerase sigma-70 factor (ECF subfamily)